MEKLKCSVNTVKNYRKEKLLPHSKLGGRVYHNVTDIQHLLVALRRLSLVWIQYLLWIGDCVEGIVV